MQRERFLLASTSGLPGLGFRARLHDRDRQIEEHDRTIRRLFDLRPKRRLHRNSEAALAHECRAVNAHQQLHGVPRLLSQIARCVTPVTRTLVGTLCGIVEPQDLTVIRRQNLAPQFEQAQKRLPSYHLTLVA